MFQFLINPWMLFGLAGIALPIVAHLLSRRRFDIVEWGAMQFLNPSRKTRRRLKLEELLLLLLRIGLISLIALGAARPLIPGGLLSGYHSAGSRTVVLVIDGSNSMSRSDGVNSVHQSAIRRATEFLTTLGADDSVALIDARDQPRSVIESPLRDVGAVAEVLRDLPPPGGSSAMLAAIEKAIGILGRTSSAAREIVVFSDRQANGWKSDSDADWARIDDLLKFPTVRPQIWAIDVAPHLGPITRNVSVGRIELSREMTVPDFPVRLRVVVRNDSAQDVRVPLRLLLDGQALAGKAQSPTVPPKSETTLEFDHAIRPAGTHILSVEADAVDDALPIDNVSHVAVHVARSIPILLVNGTPSATPSDRDTFFAELAFAPPEGKPPWVEAKVVDAAELKPTDLESVAAVVFCNTAEISPPTALALAEFVAEGNGALIACGPNTTPESFLKSFGESGLLPQLQIVRTREAPPQAEELVHVAPLSIQPGWLERFRSDPARSFLKAAFRTWTLTKFLPVTSSEKGSGSGSNVTGPNSGHTVSNAMTSREITSPVVLAQLSTSDPLMLQTRCGSGTVLILTSTLDRKWNDLPTKSDFVPLLHEAVFHVASSRSHRNVGFAEPLVTRVPIPEDLAAAVAADPALQKPVAAADSQTEFVFTTPGNAEQPVEALMEPSSLRGVFSETFAPGVYRVKALRDEADLGSDAFVVNYDHAEDEQVALTDDDKARLATNDRVRFSASLDDLTKRMYGDESVMEIWALLMTLFLLFLIAELLLTRRAIRKGYGGEALVAG